MKFTLLFACSAVVVLCGCGVSNSFAATTEARWALPELDRSASVAGPDANDNGIRDDVDAYLHSRLSEPSKVKAAQQMARALQRAILVDTTSAHATKAVSHELSVSVNCLYARFTDRAGEFAPAAILQVLEAITANTKIRLTAYLAYNKLRDSTASSLPDENTCE